MKSTLKTCALALVGALAMVGTATATTFATSNVDENTLSVDVYDGENDSLYTVLPVPVKYQSGGCSEGYCWPGYYFKRMLSNTSSAEIFCIQDDYCSISGDTKDGTLKISFDSTLRSVVAGLSKGGNSFRFREGDLVMSCGSGNNPKCTIRSTAVNAEWYSVLNHRDNADSAYLSMFPERGEAKSLIDALIATSSNGKNPGQFAAGNYTTVDCSATDYCRIDREVAEKQFKYPLNETRTIQGPGTEILAKAVNYLGGSYVTSRGTITCVADNSMCTMLIQRK